MRTYYIYFIVNTNKDKFAVCHRVGLSEGMRATDVYETYERAYKVAKAYGFGREPLDETKHH